MNDSKDYDLIGFVLASTYRLSIVKELKEGYLTPKQLSQKIDKPLSHTSKTLKELREKGLVACKTPQKRKGRIYDLTETGEKVYQEIRE